MKIKDADKVEMHGERRIALTNFKLHNNIRGPRLIKNSKSFIQHTYSVQYVYVTLRISYKLKQINVVGIHIRIVQLTPSLHID